MKKINTEIQGVLLGIALLIIYLVIVGYLRNNLHISNLLISLIFFFVGIMIKIVTFILQKLNVLSDLNDNLSVVSYSLLIMAWLVYIDVF
ncbi:MAG: hypothetical protein ACK5NF_06320 [Bacilli bacterium]